ncbi:flagellar protein FlaG [Magnetococcus sp. PR-3]|uniref:flagellar protein FlaG n=1 Tax=Magnetococcus sp. PR-3 TaxID=3120355 RepID=UPI002FCE2FB1
MMQISAISQQLYLGSAQFGRRGTQAAPHPGIPSGRADVERSQEVAKSADLGESAQALWEENVKKLEKVLSAFTSLRFSVDKDTEELVVRVVNRQTNEVVRQIPSEEIVSLNKRLQSAQGILLDANA